MGLFDKKNCDICGGKIGLLGNRKLEDGNLCKDCARKLSPWFSERRHSTVADIREQLDYREANKEKVAAFHVTRTMGNNMKVLIDEDARTFMVTSASNLQDANPDVLKYEDVTGCNYKIDEHKTELKRKDAEGKEVSFSPPRYKYEYDFEVTINVNNPYFDEISFKVNSSSVEGRASAEYHQCENTALEICETLSRVRKDIRDQIDAAAAPKQAVTCPSCGATTIPDANGCCEYCGAALKG